MDNAHGNVGKEKPWTTDDERRMLVKLIDNCRHSRDNAAFQMKEYEARLRLLNAGVYKP